LLQETDLDRVVSSTRTSLNEDANFYGSSESLIRNSPGLLDEFSSAAEAFIDATVRLSEADDVEDGMIELHAVGERARHASFTLWNVANDELDVLLQRRIDHYTSRRAWSLTVVALAVLAAVGFVTFITRSISGPLQKQAAALQESNRTLHTEIQERQRAEAALIDASREAGMAEVATGVLHNVGNVLNSVNVGVTGVRERLEASRFGHLRKTVDLIERHRDDLPAFLTTHPQGQTIPAFLSKLTKHLEDEHSHLRGQMDALQEHVDHITQIVSMQQSHARVFGVMETIQPGALIEEAVRVNADSLARHQVVIDRQFVSQRTVTTDRHRVLQILVNLLRNANQAIQEANPVERRVTIRLDDKGSDRIVISVSDTGAGISRDDLPKIFRHGFTTKKNGHGFGLHSSALAAGEMKGKLSVFSEGPARGATFALELPSTSHA
jgi:two-component system NtrC family sensor kinase